MNPNEALCRLYYAHLLMILRRPEEAIKQANLGLRLDPLKPLVLSLSGTVMEYAGDDQSAIQYYEKAVSLDTNFRIAVGQLYTAQFHVHYQNRDWDKWIEAWGNKTKGQWNEEARMNVINVFNEEGHIAGIEEMFKMNEKYGNKECLMSYGIKVERYLILNKPDKALDCLEEGYEKRNINPNKMTEVKTYNQLKDQARYIELLKKMKLNN